MINCGLAMYNLFSLHYMHARVSAVITDYSVTDYSDHRHTHSVTSSPNELRYTGTNATNAFSIIVDMGSNEYSVNNAHRSFAVFMIKTWTRTVDLWKLNPASKPWSNRVGAWTLLEVICGVKWCFWDQLTETRHIICVSSTRVGDHSGSHFDVKSYFWDPLTYI